MSEDQLPFSTLGHYAILRRLGQGGMGDVYLGYESALQRNVAIKVFPEHLQRDPELLDRFRSESVAAAKLSHPNIVPIYFVGDEDGQHFFVMRFVPGDSLAERLVQVGRFPDAEVARIGADLAGALNAAHESGLVHRDVKPGNILLDQADSPILIDFGLVKTNDRSKTATGLVMGTPDYLSPEQATGGEVGPASDLYSLGIVLYEMVTGRLPYDAHSATAMVIAHAQSPPIPLADVSPETSPELAAAIMRLLEKDPQARLASASEFQTQLQSLLKPGESDTRAEQKQTALHLRLVREGVGWFQRQAPQFAERVFNTEYQFDGAIATLEARNQELAQLRDEAKEYVGLLADEASHSSDAADEYKAAKANIESLDGVIDENCRKIDAFRCQRELIQARLKQAHETKPASRPFLSGSQKWPLIAFAVMVSIALGAFWFGGPGRERGGPRDAIGGSSDSGESKPRIEVITQDEFDVYTRPIQMLTPTPTSLRGRFHLAYRYDGATRINLFHNGRELPITQGVTPVIELKANDVIAVRHFSQFAYRAFRMVFLSEDRKAMWPVRHDDFKQVVGDIANLTPEFLKQGSTVHPHRPVVEFGIDALDGAIRDYYGLLYLPANNSEWLDGVRSETRQFAGVFDPAKLQATPPMDRPVLRLTRAAHGGPIRAVQFQPSGSHVATSDGKTIRLWDTETGKAVRTYRSAVDVLSLGFSTNGKTLAGVTPQGAQVQFSRTNAVVSNATVQQEVMFTAVPEGLMTYAMVEKPPKGIGTQSYSLRWLNFGAGNTRNQVRLHGKPKSIAFASGPESILAVYEDALGVLSLHSRFESVRTFPSGVEAASPSRSGSYFAVATKGKDLQVVTAQAKARPILRITGLPSPAKYVAISDLTNVVAFYSNAQVSFAGISSKKVLPYSIPVEGELTGIHFNPPGSLLLLAYKDGAFELWDVPSGPGAGT